jgi:hypothetical protein
LVIAPILLFFVEELGLAVALRQEHCEASLAPALPAEGANDLQGVRETVAIPPGRISSVQKPLKPNLRRRIFVVCKDLVTFEGSADCLGLLVLLPAHSASLLLVLAGDNRQALHVAGVAAPL